MAFEGILTQTDTKPARWRRVTLVASLVLHLAALAVGVVASFWRVDEMPMPAIHVMLAEAAPPPPPPPPPAGAKRPTSRPRPKPTSRNELVQPDPDKETAKPQEKPAESEGVVGGVEGGVEGGVVGGVVGADVAPPKPPPPPPPPKPVVPKTVTAAVGQHQLAINANEPPYCCVRVPRALDRSGVNLTARVRVCVNAQGQVNQVQIVEGTGSDVDAQIPNFVRRWRYRPYIVDQQPSPFCYTFRYEMTVR
ncbi:MAG TPA: TonB family protein [Polyangiaceae bacterium]